jgi:hypothetical protein
MTIYGKSILFFEFFLTSFLKQGIFDRILFFKIFFPKGQKFITKRITKSTLRQRTSDKVRGYWKSVREHIKN